MSQTAQARFDIQKKTLFSKEQLRPAVQWLRGEWVEYIKHIDVSRLVYLDEFSVNIGMTRLYGHSPRGERIYEYVPDVRFKRVSVISTIRVDGTTNPVVFSGTLNGFLFMQYIWEYVIPALKPYDILIMDCLSSHKMKLISVMVEGVGGMLCISRNTPLILMPSKPLFRRLKLISEEISLVPLKRFVTNFLTHFILLLHKKLKTILEMLFLTLGFNHKSKRNMLSFRLTRSCNADDQLVIRY